MANVFDTIPAGPASVEPGGAPPGSGSSRAEPSSGNVFNSIPGDSATGQSDNVFHSIPASGPQIKLSPIEQVQAQSGDVDPELAGAGLWNMTRGNDDVFLSSLAPTLVKIPKAVADIVSRPITDYGTTETMEDVARHAREFGLANDVSPVEDVQSSSEIGAQTGMGNLLSTFLSPLGIATVGMGGLPPALQRAVSLGFAAQMAKDTPEIARELGTEMGKNPEDQDQAKIAELETEGLGNTIMAALAGAHGLAPTAANAGMTPGQAEANRAAVMASLPAGFAPKFGVNPAELPPAKQDLGLLPPVATADQDQWLDRNPNANSEDMVMAFPELTRPEAAQLIIAKRGVKDLEIPGVRTAEGVGKVVPGANVSDVSEAGGPENAKTAVSEDLVKDLQDTMRGNQLRAERTKGTQGTQAVPTLGQRMLEELMGQEPASEPPYIPAGVEPPASDFQTFYRSVQSANTAAEVMAIRPPAGADSFAVSNVVNKRLEDLGVREPLPASGPQEAMLRRLTPEQQNTYWETVGNFSASGINADLEGRHRIARILLKNANEINAGNFDGMLKQAVAEAGRSSRENGVDIKGWAEAPGAAAEDLSFKPGGNDLTPGQIQQNIQEVINEKHAGITINEGGDQWAQTVLRNQAESAFGAIRKAAGSVLENTAFDGDFYDTEAGRRIQAIAGANGLKVVFFKGGEDSPKGFFNRDPADGRLYLRTNLPPQELTAILEHEIFHGRVAAGDPAAKRVMAGVDLNSDRAQKIAASYNRWLATHGLPPLRPEKLREEIGAFHVSGQGYHGVMPTSDAFADLGEARNAALDYHRSTLAAETKGEGALEFANPAPAQDYETLRSRREAIEGRLAEIAKAGREAGAQRGQFSYLTPELRAERFRLAKELRGVNTELLKRPEHIAELIKAEDARHWEHAVATSEGDVERARELRDEALARGAEPERDELAKADPALVERVRRDLEDRGVITRRPTAAPAGRTLGSVADWLRDNKVDSPRPSLLDQLNFVRRLRAEWDVGKAQLQQLTDKMAATWQAFKAQYRQPPKDTQFRGLMKDWFFEKEWTGLETHRWVTEIKNRIPSKLRRMALSVYVDAGGDETTLRAQLDHLPAKWQPVWDTALKLTASEKALAQRIRADFEQKLSDGLLAGLLEGGREEYGVPQVWERAPEHEDEFDPERGTGAGTPMTARNPRAKLDPRAPFFALRRTVPSYFDGIMAGGVPKSLDISDLVGLYNAEFHNSLADRGVIFALKNAKAADGKPIVQISGMVHVQPAAAGGTARTFFVDNSWKPKDALTEDGRPYQTIDHWALRDWKFASVDEAGNPIIVRGNFLVHPDHFKFLRNELEKSWLRDPDRGGKYFGWVLNSAAFLKASKFASATFHMATIGEHSIFHAFAGMPTRERLSLLNPSTRGVEIAPEKDPETLELMRNGMALGFDGQQQLFEEGLSSGHSGVWNKFPGLGDALRFTSDFLFKRYIPAVKVRAGKVILHANMERYRGKISQQQIYELTARQVNAAFGGQNWRLLGTNKTMLDVNRLLFTAPDFLLARSKVVAQAFKPYNREQMLFLLAQAGIVYTAARALNMVFSPNHDAHWEPENAFSVVIGGRAYSARFIVSDALGFANDIWSFGKHGYGATLPFLAGRIGPVPKTAYESISGHDMRTGREIHTYFQSGALRAGEIAARDIGGWFVPVGVEGFLPGAKQQDQSILGQIGLMFLGIGSHPYPPPAPRDAGRKNGS